MNDLFQCVLLVARYAVYTQCSSNYGSHVNHCVTFTKTSTFARKKGMEYSFITSNVRIDHGLYTDSFAIAV